MNTTEMKMLKQMCCKTRNDEIKNERFKKYLGVDSIWAKIR